LEHFADGCHQRVEGDASDAAAYEFDGGGARRGGGQRDIRAAHGAAREPQGHGVFAGFGACDQRALHAFAPRIIHHGIDAFRGMRFEGALHRIGIAGERDRRIGAQGCQRFKRFPIARGGNDLFRPQIFGDPRGETARRAGGAIDKPGFSLARYL
jgi:hypothetical protein